MKRSYQYKLTLSFLIIFTLFTVGIVIFEQYRSKQEKTEILESRLDSYADIVYQYLHSHGDTQHLDSLLPLLPGNIRLTLISPDGTVSYDNILNEHDGMDNHSERPEVVRARQEGNGTYIRTSASNNQPYMYYVKRMGNYYIRVALPYDIQVQSFLKPDNGFLYYILGLFIVGLLFIRYLGGRFGSSIRKLRDFSIAASGDSAEISIPRFPKDELGEISQKIVKDYSLLKENETKLAQEREKLLQHIQSSAEGVCFFNPDWSVAFYNGLFLQYLNTVSNSTLSENHGIFSDTIFEPVRSFINSGSNEKYFETQIGRQGKEFLVRVNIFDDKSFEIVLNDVTRQEKTRRLKQEMTGNIAHELRTPVTSIRGYLETILDTNLEWDKERSFLQKAYNQTLTLSELIRDMSLLTKIEETPGSFDFKPVDINSVIEKVQSDLSPALEAKRITIRDDVPQGLNVNGNDSLIYSIFRNLTDNVINHAGENVQIAISKLDEKDGYAYFSFTDNGKGIKDEAHLNRLFERFYRVDDGRTRDSGGSGLGLSIVRNAVAFHGGTITVKNRPEGGLEFLFSLPVKPIK